jgi:hypothetical protein
MRTHLFLGALIVSAPLFASRHIYNEHEITPDKVKHTLPNSEKLHEKIGKKGFYEKQYATLTFTKHTKDEAYLTKITLQWNGPTIPPKANPLKANPPKENLSLHLSGALFKKPTEELIAIHDNQVATGNWNEQKQQLTFIFKAPYPLRYITKFSIVLTVNATLDALLQEGSFSLVITPSLPEAFQTTKKAISA